MIMIWIFLPIGMLAFNILHFLLGYCMGKHGLCLFYITGRNKWERIVLGILIGIVFIAHFCTWFAGHWANVSFEVATTTFFCYCNLHGIITRIYVTDQIKTVEHSHIKPV